MLEPTDHQYRRAAFHLWDDGYETEVDPDAKLSRPDDEDGSWVSAWVWVPSENARAQEDKPLGT